MCALSRRWCGRHGGGEFMHTLHYICTTRCIWVMRHAAKGRKWENMAAYIAYCTYCLTLYKLGSGQRPTLSVANVRHCGLQLNLYLGKKFPQQEENSGAACSGERGREEHWATSRPPTQKQREKFRAWRPSLGPGRGKNSRVAALLRPRQRGKFPRGGPPPAQAEGKIPAWRPSLGPRMMFVQHHSPAG